METGIVTEIPGFKVHSMKPIIHKQLRICLWCGMITGLAINLPQIVDCADIPLHIECGCEERINDLCNLIFGGK